MLDYDEREIALLERHVNSGLCHCRGAGRCGPCLERSAARARLRRLEEQNARAPELPAQKPCRTCKLVLPLEEFSRHRIAKDGHRHDCKACARKKLKKPRAPEQRKPASPVERAGNRVACRVWSLKNSLARRARDTLGRAVRDGIIVPAKVCQAHGCDRSPARLDGHHHNYRLPLSVLWVCRACHRRLHTCGFVTVRPGLDRRLGKAPR